MTQPTISPQKQFAEMWNENRKLSMIVSQRLKIKFWKANRSDRHRMEEENSDNHSTRELFGFNEKK